MCVCTHTCTCLITVSCTAVCSLIFPFQPEGTFAPKQNLYFTFSHAVDRCGTVSDYTFIFNTATWRHHGNPEQRGEGAHRASGFSTFFQPSASQKRRLGTLGPPRLLLGEPCISQLICWARRDSHSCSGVVLGSVIRQGTHRCSATESRTAVGWVAAQHFCLLPDRRDGAVWVERTHCGAQASAGGGRNPPDGRDEELEQQQPPVYVHRCQGSFSQSKYPGFVSQEMGKQMRFYISQSYSFLIILSHSLSSTPPNQCGAEKREMF